MTISLLLATASLWGGGGQTMTDQISADRLRETVTKLASFHTRNTLSPGLTEAAEWVAAELRKIAGLKVEIWKYIIPKGRRVPEDKEVVEVIATLPGEDDRIVMVGGHLDSLNLQGEAMTVRAPGANDDGSGVALSMELARVMSQRKWKHTLVFVAFSGEEQGLNGSRALAKRAKAEGWKIDAFLNNDTVGSSSNKLGQKDLATVRVFSEDVPGHQGREMARFIEWVCHDKVKSPDPKKSFGIKLVLRKDRFGRGGDHTPFNDEGFSAVRFVETHEEYSRQHTPDDLPEFMDFAYLANVTRMNLIAMSAFANAELPPTNVLIKRDQSHNTTVTWAKTAGVRYVVYWRDTASTEWQGFKEVGEAVTATIEKVNKDDHVFAVGAAGGIPVEAK